MSRYTETRYEENFPGANLTDEEREFVEAVERYKQQTHRRFPAWSELLRLAKRMGYRKVAPAEAHEPAHSVPVSSNATATAKRGAQTKPHSTTTKQAQEGSA